MEVADVTFDWRNDGLVWRYLRLVSRWRWSLLLSLLLGRMLLEPLIGPSSLVRVVEQSLFVMIFGGAIYAGRVKRWGRYIAIFLLALWVVLLAAADGWGSQDARVLLVPTTLLIVIGALLATFRELLTHPHADVDALIGAIFGYFALATAWTVFFIAIEGWSPGSFVLNQSHSTNGQLLYLSLTTITTLGYGDVAPIHPVARIAAALEAALGVLYIAVLVGWIVSNFKRLSNNSDDS